VHHLLGVRVYFAFSDENGGYLRIRPAAFVKRFPYFIRSTLLIRAEDWPTLRVRAEGLRALLPALAINEIKWSHIWQLGRIERTGATIDADHPLHFLQECSQKQLIEFVDKSLCALRTLADARIILTVSQNRNCPRIHETNLYRMHLQEMMQRIEMELRNDDLCVLFVDAISPEQNRFLRDAYHAIYCKGDFIKKYVHIVDSLNLVYSHQSVGIQLADFIAGCFSGYLRKYTESIRLFESNISPMLRRSPNGQIIGYGVREVPRDDLFRDELCKRLEPDASETVDARIRKLFNAI